MSEQDEPRAEDLRFDEAEYAEEAVAGAVCSACRRGIADEYYESNQHIICTSCHQRIHASLNSGSGIARFLRASLFGMVAAVAGFAIYFGLLKLTGHEIGLISILVGFMVGTAVKAGSRNRGGWLYQFLAMFLVYSAIAASYGSLVLPELIKDAVAKDAVAKDAAAPAKAQPVPAPRKDFLELLALLALATVLMLGFLYALPIIAGFQAPIGLLIVGFALWEAWKINRKVRVVFKGPFRVGGDELPLAEESPGYA